MTLRSTIGNIRRGVLCSFRTRLVALGSAGPIVSFTFDDFPRTAYTAGGAILKSHGVRGTYYVAMGRMNTSNGLGDQFLLSDLQAAAADGHELASHTFHHISSRRVPLKSFLEDVRKGKNAVLEFSSASSANFAYPYGDVTLAAKQATGKEVVSCRGTCGGFNGSVIDLNLLRANRLYGDLSSLHAVRKLICENQRRKSWLIFYTHDIRPGPVSVRLYSEASRVDAALSP